MHEKNYSIPIEKQIGTMVTRQYKKSIVQAPKKIETKEMPLHYGAGAHRILLYAKFKGQKGFTRDDWNNFHPEYRMRKTTFEDLTVLAKYGLIVCSQEENQRFFITQRGELKLIHMAEKKEENRIRRMTETGKLNFKTKFVKKEKP
jgi:hypothetical protein